MGNRDKPKKEPKKPKGSHTPPEREPKPDPNEQSPWDGQRQWAARSEVINRGSGWERGGG